MNKITTAKPKRTRLAPETRRQQLLDAAISAFAEKGLVGAGHADIAKLTGVSVPTVFNYFPNRQALVDAVLTEVEEFFWGIAREVYKKKDDPFAALIRHAYSFVSAAREHTDYTIIWLEWSGSIEKDTWPRYLKFQNRLVGIVTKAVSSAQKQGTISAAWKSADISYFFVSCAQMVVTLLYTPGQTLADVESFINRIIMIINDAKPPK